MASLRQQPRPGCPACDVVSRALSDCSAALVDANLQRHLQSSACGTQAPYEGALGHSGLLRSVGLLLWCGVNHLPDQECRLRSPWQPSALLIGHAAVQAGGREGPSSALAAAAQQGEKEGRALARLGDAPSPPRL